MPRAFAALAVLLVTTTASAEPSVTERYFGGLRQRGLFDLAEGEALRRLAAGPPVEERALLVAELARTFGEHAKYVDDPEQTDLAGRADAAIVEFLEANPRFPGRVGFDVLRGELALTRGETLRWLAELQPERPDGRRQAAAALASAVEHLGGAEKALDRRLRDRLKGRTTERGEPLAAADLAELLTRTRLALGEAELERARLGDSPPDRLAAAERPLALVAKGPATDEPTWRAQVLYAEAARLGGKPDVTRRRLAAIDTASLPDPAKDAVAAVMTNLLLDENKPDRAVDFLIDYRRTRGSLTGELLLLQVRGLAQAAAAVEKLGNKAEAEALRQQIPTVARWAEEQQGGYWAYRVRLAARDAERSSRYGAEVAEQVRRAEAALAARRTDEAVAAYAEAERLAAADPAVASRFAYTRASILLKAERLEEAAAAFAAVVATYPDSDKAPEAHLLSAYALGRLNDREPTPERRDAYSARLEEHRTRFPGTPTAAEATLRLARLLEQRRQHSQAIPLLKEIASDPERGPSARAGVARNYENLLLHLESARKSATTPAEAAARDAQVAEWSFAAVRDLTGLTEPLRLGAPRTQPLSAAEAELALRSARILTNHGDDPAATDRLLDLLAEAVAVEHPDAEKEFWTAAGRSMLPLRVLSLAARNRGAEAIELIESLADAPPGDLLAVVQGLAGLGDAASGAAAPAAFGAADGPVGPRLDDLRQTAADLLSRRRAELSPEEARQLDLALAKANLAGGRAAAAAEQYEAALADRPNDKGLLTRAATELLDSGEPEAARKARGYWRRLEGLEKAGTEAWLRARAKVVESSLALGDVAEARKVLTATRLLHPQLGGAETKAIYDALQRKLDAAAKR